ncbi:uncharacterized mitochondrial protein AtMg00810-like [Lathyrus oleraceus]|uniref:uncharacterized mitochondrial protein AtMg00810-like n=1 Tax=Pisum sativum TaxID=3888 RepID=UPI0021D2D679|nr:uncharacterized mitochondrial protein AtMg00810-like [Pisum sativum]
MNEFEMIVLGNMVYFLGMKILYSEKGIIVHQLKYELKLLKRFALLNYKVGVTTADTNQKLDYDSDGDDADATKFKQLVGSLRYLFNIRPDICYAFEMDLKIKVNKPLKLMIDNKSAINLAKNLVLPARSKHIGTKYNFLRNKIHNGVLEVVCYSTQKQILAMCFPNPQGKILLS